MCQRGSLSSPPKRPASRWRAVPLRPTWSSSPFRTGRGQLSAAPVRGRGPEPGAGAPCEPATGWRRWISSRAQGSKLRVRLGELSLAAAASRLGEVDQTEWGLVAYASPSAPASEEYEPLVGFGLVSGNKFGDYRQPQWGMEPSFWFDNRDVAWRVDGLDAARCYRVVFTLLDNDTEVRRVAFSRLGLGRQALPTGGRGRRSADYEPRREAGGHLVRRPGAGGGRPPPLRPAPGRRQRHRSGVLGRGGEVSRPPQDSRSSVEYTSSEGS